MGVCSTGAKEATRHITWLVGGLCRSAVGMHLRPDLTGLGFPGD